jgi:hypothetical protein
MEEDLAQQFREQMGEYKIYTNGNHVGYCIPSKELVTWDRDVKRWSGNRKEIKERVKEIREYQTETKHVNGTIHFAFLEDEGLVCYEGNHRFRALTRNCGMVVVDVLWNATQDDIKREFRAINCAQAVSEIYLNEKKGKGHVVKIEEYVESVCTNRSGMVGKGNRANRPMFLPDDLKTKIGNLYKHFSKKENGGYSLEDVLEAITFLNDSYCDGTRDHNSDLKPRSLQKAEREGFLVFCTREPLSIREVKWALEKRK